MTFNKLQSLVPNTELHYISDSEEFFSDNNLDVENYKQYKYILFEYTIDNMSETINSLDYNNINYKIETDDFDLDYILIK
mgnify:FL=1